MAQDRRARVVYIEQRSRRVYVQTLYLHNRRRYFWVLEYGEIGRVGGGVPLDNYGPELERAEDGRRKEAMVRLKEQLLRVPIPDTIIREEVHASRVAVYLQTTKLHQYISSLRGGEYSGGIEVSDDAIREMVDGSGHEDMVPYIAEWLNNGMKRVDEAGYFLQRSLLAETE